MVEFPGNVSLMRFNIGDLDIEEIRVKGLEP
jgi:hypothetical protein